MLVSGAYFDLVGAAPFLGRRLAASDDASPGGEPSAVLSYDFWMRAFSGDWQALGRRLSVHGVDFLTVAGVMPAGFTGHAAARVDVWLPFHAAMQTPGWDTTSSATSPRSSSGWRRARL